MHLARPTVIVGLSFAASRLLGFARDVLTAAILGAGPAADAFLVALRVPALARRVFGDGGLNAAVVPAYVRVERERGEGGARAFAGDAITACAIGFAALVTVLEIAAPALVLMLAPAYANQAEQWRLAAAYLRLLVPYVGLVALASLLGALLNAQRRFVAVAIAPIASSALLVAVAFVLARVGQDPVAAGHWLAASHPAAELCQVAIVATVLGARGWLVWRRPGLSADLRRLFAAAGPALAATAVTQLIIVAAAVVASATPSAVSRLYYADRLLQLPLSLVGVGLAIVLLPVMAHRGSGSATLNRALEAALALALPAAAALAVLAQPIVTVLFERGAFSAADSAATAAALTGLALGLPAAVTGKVLAQDFFVRETTRVPLLAGAAALATTLAASLALSHTLGIFGIAAGAGLGFWINAAVLGAVLISRGQWSPDKRIIERTLRLAAATTVMAVAAQSLSRYAPASAPGLAAVCIAGLAVYAAAAFVLGAVTRADVRDALRGR